LNGEFEVYQSAVHVKGVVLNAGDPFGEPFIFILDAVRHHRLRSVLLNLL
jgi:hypothetical protein